MRIKNFSKQIVSVTAAISLAMMVLSFAAPSQSEGQTYSSSSSTTNTKKYVKTKNKCQKSNCSCSGYWGYKHANGTYEGNCQNTDGHGHTCGHGPEKHGLKKW